MSSYRVVLLYPLVVALLVAGCRQAPESSRGPATVASRASGSAPIIGFLSAAGGPSPLVEAFLQGLKELGYEEGRNIRIEDRWAKGDVEQLPALAGELARLHASVLVAGSTPASRAAMTTTSTIPIVMAVSADPVEQGFVASLAQPGGNVTGLTSVSLALSAKRLEVLRDVLPSLARVAILWNPDNPAKSLELAEAQGAAQEFGIPYLLSLPVRTPSEFAAAFDTASAEQVEALIVLGDPLFNRNHAQVVELVRAHRLPAMFETPELVRTGGLMAYGPDVSDLFKRSAAYVDKILKGTKPGDLPVERPTHYYLVFNLPEAQALGVTIPPQVLRLANEVVR